MMEREEGEAEVSAPQRDWTTSLCHERGRNVEVKTLRGREVADHILVG